MKAAVFGLGYVGSVISGCLASEGHSIVGVDVASDKVAAVNSGHSPVREPGLAELFREASGTGRLSASCDGDSAPGECDVCIICVGTPSDAHGRADLAHVTDVCRQIGAGLAKADRYHTVILRSTVPPGSTRGVAIPALEETSGGECGVDFGCVFQPEFLREGSAIHDYYDPALSIVGGMCKRDAPFLEKLLGARWSGTHRVSLQVAELVKYACNAFHGLKVAFANEIGAVAGALGADGREVMRILCADGKLNLAPTYLTPGFAFGGSCLPKDIKALESVAADLKLEVPLVGAIRPSNEAHISRAADLVAGLGQRVGIIGAAFKTGTDDMRESPALKLASELLRRGKDVCILEPEVRADSLVGANREYALRLLPDLDEMIVPDFAACDRASDVIVVARTHVADDRDLQQATRTKPVVDLVGQIYDKADGEGSYFALAW